MVEYGKVLGAIGLPVQLRRPRLSPAFVLGLIMAACTAAVLWMHGEYLFRTVKDFDDDVYMRQLGGRTFLGLFDVFNPIKQEGWFYRPTYTWRFGFTMTLVDSQHLLYVLHLETLLLHAATAALLTWLMVRLTKSPFVAVAVGVGFLLATRMFENIYWISAGSTQDASMWTLMWMHLWMSYREKGKAWMFVGCALSFLLAMCAKQEALCAPLILLAFDLYLKPYGKEELKKRAVLYLPFAALFIAAMICNVIAYRMVGGHDAMHATGNGSLTYMRGNNMMGRLHSIAVFASNLSLGIISSYCFLLPILTTLSLILVTKAKENRLMSALLAMAIGAAIIPPLEAGPHAVNNLRLYYVPGMFALAYAATYLWQSTPLRDRMERMLLAAVAIHLLGTYGFMNFANGWQTDLFVAFPAIAVIGAGYVLFRTGKAPLRMVLFAVLVGTCSLVETYVALPVMGWQLAVIIVGGLLLRKDERCFAPLLVSLCWLNPLFSMAALMAAGCSWSRKEVPAVAQRQAEGTALISQPEPLRLAA